MSWRAYLCDAPSQISSKCGISRKQHRHLQSHQFTDLGEPRTTIVREMSEAWRERAVAKRMHAAPKRMPEAERWGWTLVERERRVALLTLRRVWHAARGAA